MRIYLDTRDLINIFERDRPCGADEFEHLLQKNGHELILSYLNVMEISAPLVQKHSTTNVMRLLNRIEKLPLMYISKISQFELKEGYRAFKEKREYSDVIPFFGRFDETIEDRGAPPTSNFLNFPLSETVFTLWTEDPGLFKGYERYMHPLKVVIQEDRSISHQRNHLTLFIKAISRKLQLEGIRVIEDDAGPFAEWIYKKSSRCPSVRLGYEFYHKFVRNLHDLPKEGDIPDFGHVSCLPYVDILTADRRMSSYAVQASKAIGLEYEKRIFNNAEDVLSILQGSEEEESMKHKT